MRYCIVFIMLALLLGGCHQAPTPSHQSRCKTVRASYGQPSIKVIHPEDGISADCTLMRCQGYTQAKDRFFQMDMARRLSRGTLAEIFGEPALESKERFLTDVVVWSMGLPMATDGTYEKLKAYPEALSLLQAFTDGVNDYIERLEEEDPDVLRLYRKITHDPNYYPVPWEPKDSIAITNQMSFLLSSSLSKKAMLGSMYFSLVDPELLGIDPVKAKKLLDLRPVENISILPKPAVALDENPDPEETPQEPTLWQRLYERIKPFVFVCPDGDSVSVSGGGCSGLNIPGSNNWVVSRHFAGGEESYLANDPHLMLTGAFLEVALDSKAAGGSFHVRGVVPLGVPGILIGHNDKIGWGFTNNATDVDDLYAENFHSEKKNLVRSGREYIPVQEITKSFLVRTETGELKESAPRVLRIVPGHGPILTDHISQFKKIKKAVDGLEFSYKWTGHEGSTEIVALFDLNRAENFDQFKEALQRFEVGAQNIVYADTEGNIGYYSHGKFPKRPYVGERGVAPPFIPNMGYGKHEWDGYREKIPELYNPASGYIATANNDPYGYNQERDFSGYRDYYGFRFDPGSRIRRITDLIEAYKSEDGVLTVEDMRKIQYDHVDLLACRFLEQLESVQESLTLEPSGKAVLETLLSWKRDRQCLADRHGEETVIYHTFLAEMVKSYYAWLWEDVQRTFSNSSMSDEDRSKLFASFIGSPFALQTVYHKNSEGITAGSMETIQLLQSALERASREISRRGLRGILWGQVHRLEFMNLLDGLFKGIPYPDLGRDGTWSTVDMGAYDPIPELMGKNGDELRLPNTWAPSFRLTVVLRKNGTIDAYNSLPGDNVSFLRDPEALEELLRWRDGKNRELVPFIE